MHVPEFLEKRWIAPLGPENGVVLTDMLVQRADAHGTALDEQTRELLVHFCTDGDGKTGALPIWINKHGRVISYTQLFAHTGSHPPGG